MKFFESLKSMFSTFIFEGNAKLQDGKDIRIEGSLETGSKVFIVTPEGELPLPDGEWVLDSGETIVTTDGVIQDIVPEEETPEEEILPIEEPELPMEEDATIEEEALPTEEPMVEDEPVDKTAELESRISSLEEKLDAILSKQEAIETEYSKTISDLQKTNQEFELKFERVTDVTPVKQNEKIPLNIHNKTTMLGSYDEIYKK